MGRVLLNEPPPCPNGQWCPACLMIAKQVQWATYQDDIQAGYEKSGDELTRIPWSPALTMELNSGHYTAVCGEFPSLGIVAGLCWQHVAGGRAPQPVQPVQAQQQLAAPPPGFTPKRSKG